MKPEFSINPNSGKPSDYGPYEVSIEASFIGRHVEFNDLPSDARFPFAIDRASRYAQRMKRQFPGAAVLITFLPSNKTEEIPLSYTIPQD